MKKSRMKRAIGASCWREEEKQLQDKEDVRRQELSEMEDKPRKQVAEEEEKFQMRPFRGILLRPVTTGRPALQPGEMIQNNYNTCKQMEAEPLILL